MRWAAATALASACFLGASGWTWAASAQQKPPVSPSTMEQRKATFTWDPNEKLLRASVSFRDVVDKEVARKLQSGLPTVLVMRAYMFAEHKQDTPAALAIQSCRVAFDVWNEVYRLQISQAGGETKTVAPNLEGVLRRCGEARALPIADEHALSAGGSYFMTVIVEVNPVSTEMLERIQRWVRRPPGSTAITAGDSLFGSFVGIFVTRIGEADRTLAFRTQAFSAPR